MGTCTHIQYISHTQYECIFDAMYDIRIVLCIHFARHYRMRLIRMAAKNGFLLFFFRKKRLQKISTYTHTIQQIYIYVKRNQNKEQNENRKLCWSSSSCRRYCRLLSSSVHRQINNNKMKYKNNGRKSKMSFVWLWRKHFSHNFT